MFDVFDAKKVVAFIKTLLSKDTPSILIFELSA